MSTPIVIKDGTGTNTKTSVTSEHAVRVSPVQPPGDEVGIKILTRNKILRDFFVNSSGSKNINVNGSVTNELFSISSKNGIIKYITSMRVILNDGNMDMATAGQVQRFGDSAAAPGLANGILLNVTQAGIVTNLFIDPIQNIGDFLNYSDNFTNIKDGVTAGVDLLIFDFNFETPIVLFEGSFDAINLTVRDNLTPTNLFQILVRGYQEVL